MSNKEFLIVRGHSGSGKSTYAKKWVGKQGKHFENDQYLMVDGVYVWTKSRLEDAIKYCKRDVVFALQNGVPRVAVSNVFSNPEDVDYYKRMGEGNGYKVRIVRCTGWYANKHNVPLHKVFQQFVNVSNNPVDGEEYEDVFLYNLPIRVRELTRKIMGKVDFSVNAVSQSYINQLVLDYLQFTDQITVRQSVEYPYLNVVKYKNTVFYNADWDKALLECRGLVVDSKFDLIVRPFDKVFNVSEFENGRTPYELPFTDDETVQVVRKVNGFLGVATYSSKYDEIIYSTTGSLDSSFARLAGKHLRKYWSVFRRLPDHSFMFEICDKSDPHIIAEDFGVYLIGVRSVKTGMLFEEEHLDDMGRTYKIRRPNHFTTTFKEAKRLVKDVKHEGFMIRRGSKLVKLKSPHYLTLKLFARGKADALDGKLNKQNVAEEYYPLVDFLKANLEKFKLFNEQEKIAFITNFLQG